MASAQIVASIPGFAITYPAGKIGGNSTVGLPMNYVSILPSNEYYLDYEVAFDSDWDWVKGGKLPGLIGGSHTSGCEAIVTSGWSARFYQTFSAYHWSNHSYSKIPSAQGSS